MFVIILDRVVGIEGIEGIILEVKKLNFLVRFVR
jgi:hypothetical protein